MIKKILLIAIVILVVSCEKTETEGVLIRVLDSKHSWVEGCDRKTAYNYTLYRLENGRLIATRAETQVKTEKIRDCVEDDADS